jgi:hypothetical protein
MRYLIILLSLLIAAPSIAAPTKTSPKSIEEYRARLVQKRLESQLRRLENEAKQAKILEHKVETKTEREKRIDEESKQRTAQTVVAWLGSALSLILSFFGLGAWRNMSMREKLRRAAIIIDDAFALAEQRDKTAGAKGKEKKNIALEHVDKLKKTPELRVRGGMDWDSMLEAKVAKTRISE